MTRQHFEALAELAGELLEDLAPDRLTAERIVKRLADLCAGSNGRFDRGRFERVAYSNAARLGWDPLAAAPAPVRDACGWAAPEATCGVIGPHTAHGTGAARCSGVRGGVRLAS
jgi:hypothetical protein